MDDFGPTNIFEGFIAPVGFFVLIIAAGISGPLRDADRHDQLVIEESAHSLEKSAHNLFCGSVDSARPTAFDQTLTGIYNAGKPFQAAVFNQAKADDPARTFLESAGGGEQIVFYAVAPAPQTSGLALNSDYVAGSFDGMKAHVSSRITKAMDHATDCK